jgi:hypothetical protein
VEVRAADSWTLEELDALCASENPWLQGVHSVYRHAAKPSIGRQVH